MAQPAPTLVHHLAFEEGPVRVPSRSTLGLKAFCTICEGKVTGTARWMAYAAKACPGRVPRVPVVLRHEPHALERIPAGWRCVRCDQRVRPAAKAAVARKRCPVPLVLSGGQPRPMDSAYLGQVRLAAQARLQWARRASVEVVAPPPVARAGWGPLRRWAKHWVVALDRHAMPRKLCLACGELRIQDSHFARTPCPGICPWPRASIRAYIHACDVVFPEGCPDAILRHAVSMRAPGHARNRRVEPLVV